MSEEPPTIAREAKGIHQSLKENLNTKGPLDKEVDFQRKSLRRKYLSLLLTYPHSKESKDAETHLWMQTSYAFISAFKQRLLTLDKAMQNKTNHAQQGQDGPTQNGRNNSHIVEHRKFLQRFKQFLSDEEKFWKQLVVRFSRSYGLPEAALALAELEIIPKPDTAQEEGGEAEGPGSHGRNHFQFPPENPTAFTAQTAEEREAWISTTSKALIRLGDISRYRTFYSDTGRPKPGDDGRRGRNKRGGHVAEPLPKPKNYEKAQTYYQQAASLSPSEGNPYHQLAIIATYRKDQFLSVMYHYRALCVRFPYEPALDNLNVALTKALDQFLSVMYHYRALCVRFPYEPALDNLNVALTKALDQWRHRARQDTKEKSPSAQVEIFKEQILALNALWKLGLEKGIDKMEALTRRRNLNLFNDFCGLVTQRYISGASIDHTLVISQGALWKHRMMRPAANASNTRPEVPPPPPGTSTIIEWQILSHLLNMHRSLLEVGVEELKDDKPPADLGQRITAPFRRTLRSLRIASKWLRANLVYLMQDHEFDAYQARKANIGVQVTRDPSFRLSCHSNVTKQFWESYCAFMNALSRAFPAEKLPAITVQFDEDTEMRGFLPLRNLVGEIRESTEEGVNSHPNDWELMRITDLLKEGKALLQAQDSPICEAYSRYTLRDGIFEPRQSRGHGINVPPIQPPVPVAVEPDAPQDDGEMSDFTSKTEEELFDEIYDTVHKSGNIGDEQLDDDDEVVWNPRATLSSPINQNLPSPQVTPIVNTVPLRSPPTSVQQLSPTHGQTLSPFSKPIAPQGPATTTALDLLNDVYSGKTGRPRHEPTTSTIPPALVSDPAGHSIWSTAQDESLKFSAQPNHTYRHRQDQTQGLSTSMDLSQGSVWSSSYPTSTQDSHRNLPGSLPPTIYAQHSPNLRANYHQRIPSSNLSPGLGLGYQSLLPPHQRASHLQDSLLYSSASPLRLNPNSNHWDLGASPTVGQVSSMESPSNGFYPNNQFVNYPNNIPGTTSQPFTPLHMQNVWGPVG